MKRWLLTPALVLALAALVHAAPQIEAEPNKEYRITPQAGTFVIVAHTYTGPDAHELACQLVYQLRKRDNLPAYLWDCADKKRAERKAAKDAWQQQYPEVPFRGWYHIDDEYGVLIGGYESMEQAKKHMDEVVKKLPLPPLKLADGKSPYDMAVHCVPDGPNGKMKVERTPISPFATSFVSRNPTLGPTAKKADPFLKTLNEEEEFNLLKCPEPWTLAVQAYGGAAVYVDNRPQESTSVVGKVKDWLGLGDDKHLADQLNAAAATAHEAAKVLRKFGFDAYVLHTRTSSIVTVGGFKSADDPAMMRTAKRLAELKLDVQMKLIAAPYEIPRP
jgi:hypothetical protein